MNQPLHSLLSILVLVSGTLLAGCSPVTTSSLGVTLQAALPTSSLESTFTPSPAPKLTLRASATTTPIPANADAEGVVNGNQHQAQ
jgi:hypothetical protein